MANLFRKFIALLPETDRRGLGTVVTVSDTTTTLTTLGGGSITVQGTGVAVGSMAYYKGGVLVGEAPNLPSYEIEV